MENDKTNLYILGIVAIIGVVALIVLVTSGATKVASEDTAGQAVQGVEKTLSISANSCDADAICEVNGKIIGMNNNITLVSNPGIVRVDDDLTVTGKVIASKGLVVADRDYVGTGPGNIFAEGSLRIWGPAYMNGLLVDTQATVGGGLTVVGNTELHGTLKIAGGAGNGTGYACIDNTGKLFKKTTPCN